ncbi:hypothetical protein GCK32_018139 [Trichostrongylus colubriformis]|uniref:Uncharacterized protein n=1 Tax=Trichostrongylus colubriformis TaxID=6319 RepID=A0AAN8G2S5_TRICO
MILKQKFRFENSYKSDPRRSAAGKQNPTDQAKAAASKPKVPESRPVTKPTVVPIPVKAAATKTPGAADKATTPTPTAASKPPAKDSTPTTPAQKTNGAPHAAPDVTSTPPAGSKPKTPVVSFQ